MKCKYYLPGLNRSSNNAEALSFTLDKAQCPMSHLFYEDASAFYRKHCDSFDDFKLREKRFLDFETPNRALITHEYDIRIEVEFDYDKFYYLFNPTERLSWLKVSQEGKRLSVAKSETVKEIVKIILLNELTIPYSSQANSRFDELWNKKKGLPCFIKFEEIKNCKDFLLTVSYYDSIKKGPENKRRKHFNIFSPLLERRIEYEYFPLKNKSSWLYIKSPDHFNVKCQKPEYVIANNVVDPDFKNQEIDPEKISLTVLNKKDTTTVENTVKFNFDILVPSSLKAWFLTIYYISIITFVILLGYILNTIYLMFYEPIWNIAPILKDGDLGGFVLAVIAAIIATRGWLISEETILRVYSTIITIIMGIITVMYIVTLFIAP